MRLKKPAAVVAARRERHIGRGAPGRFAGHGEGLGLRVGPAARGRDPLPYHHAVVEDDAPHRGIGPGGAKGATGERDGGTHGGGVHAALCSAGGAERQARALIGRFAPRVLGLRGLGPPGEVVRETRKGIHQGLSGGTRRRAVRV